MNLWSKRAARVEWGAMREATRGDGWAVSSGGGVSDGLHVEDAAPDVWRGPRDAVGTRDGAALDPIAGVCGGEEAGADAGDAAQLTLDLPRPAVRRQAAPEVTAANRDAVALMRAPALWPNGAACVVGPRGSGKSFLADREFAGFHRLELDDLRDGLVPAADVAAGGRLLFEDLDAVFERFAFDGDPAAEVGARDGAAEVEARDGAAAPRSAVEASLFHLLNLVAERRAQLLITARTPPARWSVDLPDLRSRLDGLPLARIALPDDALLLAVLRNSFAERSLAVDDATLRFLASRMERSFEAAARMVDALDQANLQAGRAIKRPLVSEILEW